jgi:hypothetical protein
LFANKNIDDDKFERMEDSQAKETDIEAGSKPGV